MDQILKILKQIEAWAPIIIAVEQRGEKVWADIKAVLAENNVEADTAKLDAIIADADARRRRAEEGTV